MELDTMAAALYAQNVVRGNATQAYNNEVLMYLNAVFEAGSEDNRHRGKEIDTICTKAMNDHCRLHLHNATFTQFDFGESTFTRSKNGIHQTQLNEDTKNRMQRFAFEMWFAQTRIDMLQFAYDKDQIILFAYELGWNHPRGLCTC